MPYPESIPGGGATSGTGERRSRAALLRIKAVAADRSATAPPTPKYHKKPFFTVFFAKKNGFFTAFLQKIAKTALLQILRIVPILTGKKKNPAFQQDCKEKSPFLGFDIIYCGINGN